MRTEHCTESAILRGSINAERKPDTLTVIAISVVAAAVVDVLHELVGHGGACVLSGARPLVVSTEHFECSVDRRMISAAGTIVNLIAGAICCALVRRVHLSR
jgi:hypothetical protein